MAGRRKPVKHAAKASAVADQMIAKPVSGQKSSTARSTKVTKQQRRGPNGEGSYIQSQETPSAKKHEIFPYLALPSEIRVMIMRHYFGSHTIHINPEQPLTWSTRGPRNTIPARLDHRLCIVGTDYWKSRQTNEVPYKLLVGSPVEYEELHVDCKLESHRDSDGSPRVSRQVDINLLFVNNQIRQEVIEILYGTQTFSFNEPYNLAMFCDPMVQTQAPRLRKVQFVTDAYLIANEDQPGKFRDPCVDHPWPVEVLPALTSLTDLEIIIFVRVLRPGGGRRGHDHLLGGRVPEGPVQAVHKVVRWDFGFLRRLTNLQNVVVNIQDPEEIVDSEYIPAMNAAFEAELLSPSGSDLKRGEDEEQSWRSDVANLNHTLSTNSDERTRLSRELKRHQRHTSKAQRNVQQQSRAIERLRARSKEPSEKQMEKLTREQATLDHAERNVKAVQELLTPAEALDRGALEEEVRVLKGKIADRDERVFRYIREFEAGRGGAGSGRS